MASPSSRTNEPIAIVGSGCRFPGRANNPSQLWELLKSPRDLVTKVPKSRFNVDAFYHPDGSFHGRTNARFGYFLDQDPYAFDPAFFSIPPNEVDTIDPQQRLLLEVVYDGLVSAGQRLEDLRGSSTAVYVGMMQRDFLDSQNYDLDALNIYAATGTAASILSNRVSYVFDWHGPSMTFDTACSSSLVAVHHAVEQLRAGTSDIAIAAGSNLMLGPVPFISASKLNMFSPNGRSRMWDAAADGYARGEGVAAVVLKRLSQAIADGDTIECVIRESGINQDGKTAGITMPNPAAQESLIRQVYRVAGLDLSKSEDQCQYFEAHGTGTPAGDPQEANAISSAFFSAREKPPGEEDDPLYVGSIKTVIGHTEGTAGIAGLIKASLMIQHGELVPNMLFEELSPRVAPFYDNLEVVTRVKPWPKLEASQPRRVSVNSFGFGGTNAHVIVESYEPLFERALESAAVSNVAPIVLSAHSIPSLKAQINDLKQVLENNSDVQLNDLAWTLMRRRSNLSWRHSIAAKDMKSLIQALERDASLLDDGDRHATNSDVRKAPEILGIFTGQGAQWPSMGRILVSTIPYAQQVISELDQSLHDLPSKYKPTWHLLDELLLEGEASNVGKALYSQTLTCAVQIVLTKLLQAAGVAFKVVIGHSSGEIACAFAAGYIPAWQAIRIAYLRGLTSSHAGSGGSMLAAGTSFDDALELCELEAFRGRVAVAASNAPESVTLSGDKDAILEIQEVLSEENRFARLLKIDRAYHSHHMGPCAVPYVEALRECQCDKPAVSGPPSSIWISSVYEGQIMQPKDVSAEYWRDNLLSPVLFSFAVEQAIVKHTPLDACIEVGPHPALKNPTLQTIENCAGAALPYFGSMERNRDDVEAFTSSLGSLWTTFGSTAIDIEGLYSKTADHADVRDISKQLPSYSWDHSRSYRKESRALKSWLGADVPHLLLGKRSISSSPTSIQWQNFIRPRDIPWLDGHSLQGQTVFPGAGYVVMALEAALETVVDRTNVKLLEVLDLSIDKAVTFEDENSIVELNVTLDTISRSETTGDLFSFAINSSLARETGLTTTASGKVALTYGSRSTDTLPSHSEEPPHSNNVSVDRFYNMLSEIGYGYAKEFRGISDMRRGDNKATGTMDFHSLSDRGRDLVIHPASLDVAFQCFIAAYTAPGDRRLRSLLVPTGIDRIALNPILTFRKPGTFKGANDSVKFVSTSAASVGKTVEGDIEVFDLETGATIINIEGLSFKAFSPASADDDHQMFSKWEWNPMTPEKLLDDEQYHATEQDKRDVAIIERITYYYIRHFLSELTDEDRRTQVFCFKKYIQWCDHMFAEAQAGSNVWYEQHWDEDDRSIIYGLIEKNKAHPFVRLIQRVGEGVLDTFRNSANPFDLMDHDGLLTEFYGGTVSYGHSYSYYQRLLEQINHRYKNLDVLEIGAGTGGATRYFLNDDRRSFNSFTFTDISSAFFEQAKEAFAPHVDRMDFRPLDIRRDPSVQDFPPHSYDLIIASNVLHATPKLDETLRNVRSLLKPGGQLIVIEVAHREHTRIGYIFGLFPDWWAGHDEGRILEPFISYDKWDTVLKSSGFSGVDSRTLDPDSRVFPNGVFSSHAADDLVARLDNPLSAAPKDSYAPLVLVGGASQRTAEIIDRLANVIPNREITRAVTIPEIIDLDLQPGTSFLVLAELDKPTFAALDDEMLDALQTLFNAAQHVLWVTESAWTEDPVQAMTIGLLRTLRMEYPDVGVQVLDLDTTENFDVKLLAETLSRLEDGDSWEEKGLLWTQEPELYLQKGKIVIPRLKFDKEKNYRLNSNRRPILVDANPTDACLEYAYDEDKPTFRLLEERFVPSQEEESSKDIEVYYSLPYAVRIQEGESRHIVLGKTTESDAETFVVALTQNNSSRVQVPSSQLIAVDKSYLTTQSKFLSIAAELTANSLLSKVSRGMRVLVCHPPSLFVQTLARRAADLGITIYFASSEAAAGAKSEHWIQFHENETQRSLRQKLPKNISLMFDFAAKSGVTGLSKRIAKYLPTACTIRQTTDIFQETATSYGIQGRSNLSNILGNAAKAAEQHDDVHDVALLTSSELLSSDVSPAIDAVIDWRAVDMIPSRVRSMETDRLFVDDKTYLLVGLAGDLGRSIARYMVERGARYIVLSSRSPKIDQRWIDELATIGGEITVLPMDVSNGDSVDKGLAQIEATLPQIAGVAFGPLVLQDVMFKNMDLSMLEMVLAPKVDGARLLNERLSDPNKPLDFFVMFSSFVMVSGNPGQAAYSAANAYTHALAQQRRARGMAGSTMDIGAVFGVGFIARAGREHEYDVVKFMFDEVNEWELHSLFAEAVVSGRDRSTDNVEVITGMPLMDPSNRDRIPYYDDPRFSGFKVSDQRNKAEDLGKGAGSVKEQLLQAKDMQQVNDILLEGLSGRVRVALQLTAADELALAVPLIDQGVDSLSAVTISSWFTKSLGVEVPLLRILGGASVNDLIEEVVPRLTTEAIPLASNDGSAPIASVEPVAQHSSAASSSNDASDSGPNSQNYDTQPTTSDDESEEDVTREVPLSLIQEYSWKQKQLSLSPDTFNSTIGMYMKGPIHLDRLSWAFNRVLQRHDAFRTSFHSKDDDAKSPLATVLPSTRAKFEAIAVADRAAADQGFRDLEKFKFDLEGGLTIKIVCFHWSPTDCLLIIAYHRLVGDGWTTEHIFVEASQLYSGVRLERAPKYSDYALRQREATSTGAFEGDLDYWRQAFETLPPRLHVLQVPGAKAVAASSPPQWDEYELSCRLNRMVAVRVRDRSRKHKVSPMHYYLAAFHVLLARLAKASGNADIAIGLADTNRQILVDQSTMGFFANMLPIRLGYAPDQIFNEVLSEVKEQVRAALLHSSVPYIAVLDRLGLPSPDRNDAASHAPLFQAVFDYKQGQTESGTIGEASIVDSRTPRAGSPYDITLEMSDDPSKEPLVTIKVQKGRYEEKDADVLMDAYLSVVSIFSRNPALRVADGRLDQGAKARA